MMSVTHSINLYLHQAVPIKTQVNGEKQEKATTLHTNTHTHKHSWHWADPWLLHNVD